jgi:hypothetical protein
MPDDNFGEVKHTSEPSGPERTIAVQLRRDSLDQPRQLADRARLRSDRRRIEFDDIAVETFTLPLETARLEVRAVIGDISRRGYQKIVERWRQLPDGQIEFTLRRLPVTE